MDEKDASDIAREIQHAKHQLKILQSQVRTLDLQLDELLQKYERVAGEPYVCNEAEKDRFGNHASNN